MCELCRLCGLYEPMLLNHIKLRKVVHIPIT
jgi:hypothetical protein